jgi:hypothetical protein
MAKNAQIGGILSFFEVLKWIPIGAAGRMVPESSRMKLVGCPKRAAQSGWLGRRD